MAGEIEISGSLAFNGFGVAMGVQKAGIADAVTPPNAEYFPYQHYTGASDGAVAFQVTGTTSLFRNTILLALPADANSTLTDVVEVTCSDGTDSVVVGTLRKGDFMLLHTHGGNSYTAKCAGGTEDAFFEVIMVLREEW